METTRKYKLLNTLDRKVFSMVAVWVELS